MLHRRVEVQPEQSQPRRSVLNRALNLFSDMRPGEGRLVLVMFSNIFIILAAYYILKIVREQLTIGGVTLFGLEGDEIKAYLPAPMALLLVVIVPAYGWLASNVDRKRLIRYTMLFVIGALLAFFVWGQATGIGTAIGLSFYIFLGIVNVFLIAQFWSFANDIYTEAQGKRLFAMIAVGQSAGAILGPRMEPALAKMGLGSTFAILLIVAGMFGVALVLYSVAERMAGGPSSGAASDRSSEQQPLSKGGGFALIFGNQYFRLLAAMILITNLVNTTGEYLLGNAAKTYAYETATVAQVLGDEVALAADTTPGYQFSEAQNQALKEARGTLIRQFYGDFFFWVNLLGLFIQLFLVARIFKYFGVAAALFVLPVIAFGGYAAIGILGGVSVLRIAKTLENSTDYSLQNTLKQALFLPTSRVAKYKVKAAIDTFFVRFGDVISAGVIALGLRILKLEAMHFALVNVFLCAMWLLVCVGLAREYKKLSTGSSNSDRPASI